MPTYKEQQILDKVCKVTRQKQIKYYDFIPFCDFQNEKIIFNCQPSHFSPCPTVPEVPTERPLQGKIEIIRYCININEKIISLFIAKAIIFHIKV